MELRHNLLGKCVDRVAQEDPRLQFDERDLEDSRRLHSYMVHEQSHSLVCWRTRQCSPRLAQ